MRYTANFAMRDGVAYGWVMDERINAVCWHMSGNHWRPVRDGLWAYLSKTNLNLVVTSRHPDEVPQEVISPPRAAPEA